MTTYMSSRTHHTADFTGLPVLPGAVVSAAVGAGVVCPAVDENTAVGERSTNKVSGNCTSRDQPLRFPAFRLSS